MKIVIDARESGTSTGRYVDKLIENLAVLKPEMEITILAKSPRLAFLRKLAPGFHIERCDIPEFGLDEQTKLARQLNRARPDLVHFGMTQQPVFYSGRAVTTIHDLTTAYFRNPAKNPAVFWFKQRVYRWVIKRVAKKSRKILTISHYSKDQIVKFTGVPAEKITVTYLAADKITEAPEPVAAVAGAPFVMYVGRPQPHKNLDRLVEAFEIVRQSQPGLKLVLAGKKDRLYDRLEKKVADEKIEGVILTGFVSEGQLRWLYEHAGAYVFPSLSEGFGLPGLEAMVHGTPVVSSDLTSLPEIYGQAALYFNPLNINDIADKISAVLTDEKLAKKLASAGLKQVAKYSWRQMAAQTLQVYREALGLEDR